MVRLQPDNFYRNGSTALRQAWWLALDTAQAKLLNGDDGGTYAPSGLVTVGGAGIWFSADCTLTSGATAVNALGSGARFVHADNDFNGLAVGHTYGARFLHVSGGRFIDVSGGTARFAYDNGGDRAQAQTPGCHGLWELRVHNGATFYEVVVTFKVGSDHSSNWPVGSLPRMRVFAVDGDGTMTILKTTGGAAAGGWMQIATPASAAAWYASGNAQTFTYLLDAGTIVDTSRCTYFAEVIDESGTNAMANNAYHTFASYFQAIADMRFQ